EALRRVLADRRAYVLVTGADGELIGSVIGTVDGWRGHVYPLAGPPQYRRRGIARALIAGLGTALVAQGAERMDALVEEEHPLAVSFWDSSGYQLTPQIVRYVRNLGVGPSAGKGR